MLDTSFRIAAAVRLWKQEMDFPRYMIVIGFLKSDHAWGAI